MTGVVLSRATTGHAAQLLPALWVTLAVVAAALLMLWQPIHSGAVLLAVPAAVLLPALALALVVRAGHAGGASLAALGALVLSFSDLSLRQSADEGFDLQSVAKLALWLSGLLLLAWPHEAVRRSWRAGPAAWLAAFGLWCLVSSAWSVTPAYTLAAALAWLGVWACAASLAGRLPLRSALLALGGGLMGVMAASLLLLAVAPARALTAMEDGEILRLSGVFASPNNLGRAAALLVLLGALTAPLLPRRGGVLWLVASVGLGGLCLLESNSRGSLIALLAAGSVALALWRPWAVVALMFAALVVVLTGLLWPAGVETALLAATRGGHVGELSSATGRTEIWAATWGLIHEAPWLGHGYAASRAVLPDAFQSAYGWSTTSAHNLWLQGWLTTGLVGLLLITAAIVAWLRRALRAPHIVRETVVVFVLVVGLIEASALGPSVNMMSFVWIWAMALVAQEPKA